MRICIVHNEYRIPGGEDLLVRNVCDLLERRGHEVSRFFRTSVELGDGLSGKARAFAGGITGGESRARFRSLLTQRKPELVHVHNVYPLISPAVLPECRPLGIPVVMTAHNFRLVCPNGLLFSKREVCHRCLGGREYQCVLRNCEEDIFKSLSYAFRSYLARKRRWFLDHVTLFIALTEFQRSVLVSEGFSADRIDVVPNYVPAQAPRESPHEGEYVAFLGRLSREKGVSVLLEAARNSPEIQFRFAGAGGDTGDLIGDTPGNCRFLGQLSREGVAEFLLGARMLAFPSVWYEGFPLSLVEAMNFSLPVVCSRIGGLPEIVGDGTTGLLAEPGDAADLAEKIRALWNDPGRARRMGEAGRVKVSRNYREEIFYENLMRVYEKAIRIAS